MGDVLVVLVVVGVIAAVLWARRGSSSSPGQARPTASAPPRSGRPVPASPPSLADLEREMAREVEAEARRLMPQVEAEAARMMRQVDAQVPAEAESLFDDSAPAPTTGSDDAEVAAAGVNGGPSWMDEADWAKRVAAYERQGRTGAEIAATAAYLERRGPKVKRTRQEAVARSAATGVVTRDVYVAKEDEARYLTRDAAGQLRVRLVDTGDRLSVWSPVDGGALINPKGPGLRSLGLYSSYARGSQYNASAFKAADLRKGKWVDLVREPDNEHDKNAVAMCAPGSTVRFAHVQRGRAPAIARRMDAGEDMAAVSLRGPGAGHDDDTAFLIIGARADLTAMLNG